MSNLRRKSGTALPADASREWQQQFIDNYWLNLGDTSKIEVVNPFSTRTQYDIEHPHVYCLDLMRRPDYFAFTCSHLFGKTLWPFQLAILNELWNRPFPMLIGSRGMGKSFLLALYAMLRAVFQQGSKIVIVGAAFRQAKVVFDYCQDLWEHAPVLRDLVGPDKKNGPRRDVDRCSLRMGDSIIIALPLGDGCVAGSTQVTFSDGFAEMSDEHVGSGLTIRPRERNVWSGWDGDFVRTDEAYFNGISQTKVVTTSVGLTVEGTHNHRLRVLDGLDVVWKRLDEIRVGDRLLVDRSWKWHDGNAVAGVDEAYALGLMIGDGCWTHPNRLGFATKDQELANGVSRGTHLDFRLTKDGVHYVYYGKQQRADWLRRWGLKTVKAACKCLPPVILKASREALSACLSGLFDTDGHVQVGKAKRGITVSLTNTSERLVRQVQYILLHFGIVAVLRSRVRSEKWAKCYELLLTGDNARLFAQHVGFRLTRKKERLEQALASAKRNGSFADEVPNVQSEMLRVASENRIRKGERDRSLDAVRPTSIARKKCITRPFVETFLKKYAHTGDPFLARLRELANPNIYYDTVVGIEDGSSPTYDIHVPGTHEYCAGGFFSHNTKIRGQRANIIIADEFASIPKDIFETVVRGFAAVNMNPADEAMQEARKEAIKELGMWTDAHEALEEASTVTNQTILSGTAYYSFNHFYDYWKRYKAIVESKGDVRKLAEAFGGPDKVDPNLDWKDYSVIRVPVTKLPAGFMNAKQIAQAKATVHVGTYQMEYGAVFATDSNGFYKRSLIEGCVVGRHDNPIEHNSCGQVRFHAVLKGQPDAPYVMAIDPASEHDNCSIAVLECWPDHRRIVHCWTTTRSRHKAKLKRGLAKEQDFYADVARKIRDLLKVFPCIRIGLDSQGGGIAIMEALQDEKRLLPGERKILPTIDPEKPRHTDGMSGDHIIEIINFAKAEWTRDANHGMRKDFEDKALLFPSFDPAIVALAHESDKAAGRVKVDPTDASYEKLFDTLEDCVLEIEELKDELAAIVHSQTGTSMRDRWDTPEIKQAGGKKGRLRKDRYSALLMANMVARTLQRAPKEPEYEAPGGFAHDLKGGKQEGSMWVCMGGEGGWWTEKWGQEYGVNGAAYGAVVKRGR
jgi:intein/homing endonuclease